MKFSFFCNLTLSGPVPDQLYILGETRNPKPIYVICIVYTWDFILWPLGYDYEQIKFVFKLSGRKSRKMTQKNYQTLRNIGQFWVKWDIEHLIINHSIKLEITSEFFYFQPYTSDFYQCLVFFFVSFTLTSYQTIWIRTLGSR